MSEGGRRRTVTRPLPTRTLAPERAPAGQSVPHGRLGVRPRRQRERARFCGVAREHGRVADREELRHRQSDREEDRQRAEHLDRGLSVLAPHGTASSEARAASFTGAVKRVCTIGTGTRTRAPPVAVALDLEPPLESLRQRRPRRRRNVLAHQLRARRGPCRVRGHPRRVPDEDQLPDDQADREQNRDDCQQLNRRLSLVPRHACNGRGATVTAQRARVTRWSGEGDEAYA